MCQIALIFLLKISVCSLLTDPSDPRLIQYPEDLHTVKLNVYRYKGIVKGINEGFYDGHYKGGKINKKCFDNNMIEQIYFMYASIKHGYQSKTERWMRFMTALVTVYKGIKNDCHADPFIYDTLTYCFVSWQCVHFQHWVNLGKNLTQVLLSAL